MSRALGVCLLLWSVGCTRGGAVDKDRTEGFPRDCDGELLLSVPELPLDLQRWPAGGVLVVDRGGLVLRSEQSFDVVRHLAPGVDGWHRGSVVGDGGTWRGETFDGHRYDVDVSTGAVQRLYDARVSRDERELRERSFDPDPEHAFEEARRAATALVQSALEKNAVPVDQVPELEATAALLSGDSLVLADITGVLWRIDLKAKKVDAKAACPMCSPKVAFVKTSAALLALDREGNAVELSEGLEPVRDGALRPELPGNDDPLMVTDAFAVDEGRKIAWLASDGQHGLFDTVGFAPKKHERPVGLAGVTDVALWGDGKVAYTAQGVVEARAIPTGAVLLRKAGNFSSVEALPQGELKALRNDGTFMTFDGEPVEPAPPPYQLTRTPAADGGTELVVLSRGAERLVVSDDHAGAERTAALRRGVSFDARAEGYVLAGGGAPALLPSGRLEVYCAPKAKLLSKVPARIPVPDVAELEGVLEIALRELPPRYESLAAEPDGTAWILAVSEGGERLLARLTPDATAVELHPLPSKAPFSRLIVSGDGSLWALSGPELARRQADGSWKSLPLGVDGEFKQVIALPSGEIAAAIEGRGGERELVVTANDTLVRRPLKFTREVPPLVALPNGVLVPADPKCAAEPCERGFVVRDGAVDTRAPLIGLISARKPLNAWLRGEKIILLGQKWASVDVATGKVTEELSPQVVFKKRKHPVGPRPAPTPYLDSLEVELIRFVDRDGRPLALAALRGPAWIPEIAQAFDAVDTAKGTWARKGTLSVMFWDGKSLRAYFHPETREGRLRQMQ